MCFCDMARIGNNSAPFVVCVYRHSVTAQWKIKTYFLMFSVYMFLPPAHPLILKRNLFEDENGNKTQLLKSRISALFIHVSRHTKIK